MESAIERFLGRYDQLLHGVEELPAVQLTTLGVLMFHDSDCGLMEHTRMKSKGGKGIIESRGTNRPLKLGLIDGAPLAGVLTTEHLVCESDDRRLVQANVREKRSCAVDGGCNFAFTRRTHADGHVSWEFANESVLEHSEACSALPPGERTWTTAQRVRLLVQLSLGVHHARIIKDETDLILRLTDNGNKLLYAPLMPRPLVLSSELSRLGVQHRVPGYAQRDKDDVTSAKTLVEEALAQKLVAGAVFKPCGVAMQDVMVSTLMPQECKDVMMRGNLTTEDFVFLLLSPVGKRALEEYGSVVAVDGSGGTTVYKHLQIVAFVVSNEGRSTVAAVAFVLSEREEVYSVLFSLLKMWAPAWRLRAVQSDLAPAAFNAARSLQHHLQLWGDSVTVAWFHCMWHLKKAVRAELVLKLVRPKHVLEADWSKVRTVIYQLVMFLMGKRCDKRGNRVLHHIDRVELARDIATSRRLLILYRQFDVLRYVDAYLFNRVEHWAMHARYAFALEHRAAEVHQETLPCGTLLINIPSILVLNMYLEAFFKIIKYTMLDGRQGNRLDVVLGAVMNFFKRDIVKLIARPVAALLASSEHLDILQHEVSIALDRVMVRGVDEAGAEETALDDGIGVESFCGEEEDDATADGVEAAVAGVTAPRTTANAVVLDLTAAATSVGEASEARADSMDVDVDALDLTDADTLMDSTSAAHVQTDGDGSAVPSLRESLLALAALASRDDVDWEAAGRDEEFANGLRTALRAGQRYAGALAPVAPGSLMMRTDLGRLRSQRGCVQQRSLPALTLTLSAAQAEAADSAAALAGAPTMVQQGHAPVLRDPARSRPFSGLRQRCAPGDAPLFDVVTALLAAGSRDLAVAEAELRVLEAQAVSFPGLRTSLALRSMAELKGSCIRHAVGRASGSKSELIHALVQWVGDQLRAALPHGAPLLNEVLVVDVALVKESHDEADVRVADWVFLIDRGNGSMDETPLVRGTLVRRTATMQPRLVMVPRTKLIFLVPGVKVNGMLE